MRVEGPEHTVDGAVDRRVGVDLRGVVGFDHAQQRGERAQGLIDIVVDFPGLDSGRTRAVDAAKNRSQSNRGHPEKYGAMRAYAHGRSPPLRTIRYGLVRVSIRRRPPNVRPFSPPASGPGPRGR